MKKSNSHAALVSFVLEKAASEPVPRRVELYRGLAIVCGDADDQKQLADLANQLENADKLCREFNFSFVQKQTA